MTIRSVGARSSGRSTIDQLADQLAGDTAHSQAAAAGAKGIRIHVEPEPHPPAPRQPDLFRPQPAVPTPAGVTKTGHTSPSQERRPAVSHERYALATTPPEYGTSDARGVFVNHDGGGRFIFLEGRAYPVAYDKANATYRITDSGNPLRPSIPVALDPDGHWRTHDNVGLKGGGNDPDPSLQQYVESQRQQLHAQRDQLRAQEGQLQQQLQQIQPQLLGQERPPLEQLYQRNMAQQRLREVQQRLQGIEQELRGLPLPR